jgi:hypothetical protein
VVAVVVQIVLVAVVAVDIELPKLELMERTPKD